MPFGLPPAAEDADVTALPAATVTVAAVLVAAAVAVVDVAAALPPPPAGAEAEVGSAPDPEVAAAEHHFLSLIFISRAEAEYAAIISGQSQNKVLFSVAS